MSHPVDSIPQTPAVQPIPEQFTHDGYVLRLVERSGDSAIFSQARPSQPIRAFEVVRLENRPAENVRGTWYPAREIYPRSEAWGIRGWTCLTLDAARRKLQDINQTTL